MIVDDLIRLLARQVFVTMGKSCEPLSVERKGLADAKDGVSGDYDSAGEWQIQCGTDKPFLLSLTNADTKDPMIREKRIKQAILRCVS
jgi:hypothetical protein